MRVMSAGYVVRECAVMRRCCKIQLHGECHGDVSAKKYNAVEAARRMRGEGDARGYQTAGIAKANILLLRGCIGGNSLDSDRLGDNS